MKTPITTKGILALGVCLVVCLSAPVLATLPPPPPPPPPPPKAPPPPPEAPSKPPTGSTGRDQLGLTSKPKLPYDPKLNPIFEMLKDLGDDRPAGLALHRLLFDPEIGPDLAQWLEDRAKWIDLKETYEASLTERGNKGQKAKQLREASDDMRRASNEAEASGSGTTAKALRDASDKLLRDAEKLEAEAKPPPKAERDRVRREIKDAKKAADQSGKKLDKSIRDLVERAEKELQNERPQQEGVRIGD